MQVDNAGTAPPPGGDSGAGGGGTASSDAMQVDGLPVFNMDTRGRGAATAGSAAAEGAFGGAPFAFPMHGMAQMRMPADFPMGGAPGGGTVDMAGMVLQVDMTGDGGQPSGVQTTGFSNMSEMLAGLLNAPPRGASGPQTGGGGRAVADTTPAAARGNTPPAEAPAGDTTTPAAAHASPVRHVQSPQDLQQAMSTLAMNLSRDLDRQRSRALSDEERQSETEQLSLQYLQQVPELMRNVAPRATASIQSLLENLGHPSPSVSGAGEAAAGDRATSPVALPSPPPPAARATVSSPPLDAAPAEGAPETAASAPSPAPVAAAEKGASPAGPEKDAAAGRSSAEATGAQATTSAGNAAEKRSPKGLARGLKRRPADSKASGSKGASASMPAARPTAGAPTPPSDSLMAMMSAVANSGAASTAGPRAPPAAASAAAAPAGGDGLAGLMQSMMPMMNNMLGGRGPSAGSARSGPGAQPPRQLSEVLKDVLGPNEGQAWAATVRKDRKAMAQQKKVAAHSAAYTAGAPPRSEGGGGLF